MIDFDKAKLKLIRGSRNVAVAEKYGFANTIESICLINSLVICIAMQDVICDDLTDEQVENVNIIYDEIRVNPLFKERNKKK